MGNEEFIDTYAAAEEIGVSRATIWNLIKKYQIERFRMPGELRTVIRRSDMAKLRQPIPLGDRGRGRPRGGGQGKALAAA